MRRRLNFKSLVCFSLLLIYPEVKVLADAIDWPTLSFTQVVTNTFSHPTVISHAGDTSGRLFVVEQPGRVWIVQSNNVLAPPFLDISNRVMSTGAEQGLLGLAFPPGFSTNNHFYVDYTRRTDGSIVISRFSLTATNSSVADTNSEQIIMIISKPTPPTTYNNHNGGQLAFGPDGYLYIGVGDGGSEGDPLNNGQKTNTPLAKLLRIDVESGVSPYAIPTNNPFVANTNFPPETWAWGLRNPWRFSFDRLKGDLYIGDVGQGKYEEIDFQSASSAGGQNYGWRIMEGISNNIVPGGFTNFSALTLPVAAYSHVILPTDLGGAVIGGYVYRGPSVPRMDGVYFYGDFMAGWIWGLKQAGTNWQNLALLSAGFGISHFMISTFGEDDQGHLYLADYYTGKIYQVQDSLQVWTPTFSPPSGINNSNTVTVSCVTTGAVIHYTSNGIDPTTSDPGITSGGTIQVATGVTNKLRAFRSDLTASAVATAIFTNKVGTPLFSPPGSAVTNGTLVSISTITPGATVYYTTNGTTPTAASLLYSAPITIVQGMTLEALGIESGYSNSTVATATYSIAAAATPVFNPPSGPITNGTPITITCSSPSSTIYYTVNGTTPTTNSPVYSAPVVINGGTTLNAFAVATAFVSSSVRSVFYQLVQTATPVFNPASGPITYGTNVSISCATPGSTIYYTLDGSIPTMSSQIYSNPVIITGDTNLSAYAVTPGYLDSAVQSTLYTLIQAATPIFSPFQGPLTNLSMISISCATSNSLIRYTLDGSNPDTASPIYSSPLPFSGPVTLSARSYASHFDPSGVAAEFYGLLNMENYVVTTFAGGSAAGFTNAARALARFSNPQGICIDNFGNFYVADSGNNAVRKISTSGQVTTVGTNGGFSGPTGVCVDSVGNVYVADSGNCNRVCKIDTNDNVTVFANVTVCGPGIGNFGPGLWQLTLGPDGDIYIGYWARVDKITPNGTVIGLAGTGCNCAGGWGLNVGPGVDAETNVYSATGGNLWITTPDGSTVLFAGGNSGFSDGPRLLAGFYSLQDVVVDSSTNFFLSDNTRIRKLRSDWVDTLAGTGVAGYRNGRGSVAQFNGAAGLCVDTNGNIYVADSGNNCIREISPDTYGIGIPDWWQLAHYGHIGIDPNADPDHDGMSNFEEFWAGTDPLNANSILAINPTSVVINGSVQIRWQTVTGKTYTVQYSSDLISWYNIGNSVLGDSSIATVNDPSPISQNGKRYYRVAILSF
jgi:glucose/arabinose dehydrogenase